VKKQRVFKKFRSLYFIIYGHCNRESERHESDFKGDFKETSSDISRELIIRWSVYLESIIIVEFRIEI